MEILSSITLGEVVAVWLGTERPGSAPQRAGCLAAASPGGAPTGKRMPRGWLCSAAVAADSLALRPGLLAAVFRENEWDPSGRLMTCF